MKWAAIAVVLALLGGAYAWWHNSAKVDPVAIVWISESPPSCIAGAVGHRLINDISCDGVGKTIQTQFGLPPGTRIQISAGIGAPATTLQVVSDSLTSAGYVVAEISQGRRAGFIKD